MAFGGGLGFTVDLDATKLASPSLALAAEGRSRFVVEVPVRQRRRFERKFDGLATARLGTVAAADATLRWQGRSVAALPILSFYDRWRAGLGLP